MTSLSNSRIVNIPMPFDIEEPEKIDMIDPSNVHWSEAAKFTEDRIKTIQHIAQVVQQGEEQFGQKERAFLVNAVKFLESFATANDKFIKDQEEEIKMNKQKMQKHRPILEKNDNVIEEIRTLINTLENRIRNQTSAKQALTEKIEGLSDMIAPAELGKLKIKKPEDVSNEVFRWIMTVLYKDMQVNYEWKLFKKTILKADKGKGFIARLKAMNLQTLQKEDFVAAKKIEELANTNPAFAVPTKGKDNLSFRRLLEYISSVAAVGDCSDKIEYDRKQLEEKKVELEVKLAEGQEAGLIVKQIEEKLCVSTYFVDTLNKLRPMVTQQIEKVKERLVAQDQYRATIEENLKEAVELVVPATTETKKGDEDQDLNVVKGGRFTADTGRPSYNDQEMEFGGRYSHNDEQHYAKAMKNVPRVDLRESEFATVKAAGCQSCNMF